MWNLSPTVVPQTAAYKLSQVIAPSTGKPKKNASGYKPQPSPRGYREILADVIVYIFAHLHRALRTEGKVLDIN